MLDLSTMLQAIEVTPAHARSQQQAHKCLTRHQAQHATGYAAAAAALGCPDGCKASQSTQGSRCSPSVPKWGWWRSWSWGASS